MKDGLRFIVFLVCNWKGMLMLDKKDSYVVLLKIFLFDIFGKCSEIIMIIIIICFYI